MQIKKEPEHVEEEEAINEVFGDYKSSVFVWKILNPKTSVLSLKRQGAQFENQWYIPT